MQEREIESFRAKIKLWGKIPEMLITIKYNIKVSGDEKEHTCSYIRFCVKILWLFLYELDF